MPFISFLLVDSSYTEWKQENKSQHAQKLAMLTEFWTIPCRGLYCDNTQSEDVLSQQWVSPPRADTSSQF